MKIIVADFPKQSVPRRMAISPSRPSLGDHSLR
jgi:hypothetical protein